jgi:hypothetical protein
VCGVLGVIDPADCSLLAHAVKSVSLQALVVLMVVVLMIWSVLRPKGPTL